MNYESKKEIGFGTFGTVYECTYTDGSKKALKIIKDLHAVCNEIYFTRPRKGCPHLLQREEVCVDYETNELYIFMPLGYNQNIFKCTKYSLYI